MDATLSPDIIGRAIDRAPLSRPLLFIVGVAAAGFFFDSFDIVIVSYALPSIAREFALVPHQVGLIGSSALAGMGVGSWIWGWIADRWGRRFVFAATVLTFSLFTGVAGLSASIGFLIGARFLTGLGLGGMVPIDGALVAEFAPARLRGRISAALPLCWPIGIFAAAGISLAVVPTIGWRWLFVIGVLPALLAFMIRRGIPESPRWLAAHGQPDAARASLRYIGVDDARLAEARREAAAYPSAPAEPQGGLRALFTSEYARRLVHTCPMWFCSNFAASAFSVWLPTIYATFYHIQLTRTLVYTFIVAGAQVVARVMAFSAIDRVGRKPLIVIGFGIAGFAALAFTQVSTESGLLLVAIVYAFFADIGSLAMTVYTPEVFPLRHRGVGTAFAMGWGRFGGMVSPFLAGLLLTADNITLVWCLMSAMQVFSASITLLLARETAGRNLELVSQVAPARQVPAA
jgi:putative MFS transporter